MSIEPDPYERWRNELAGVDRPLPISYRSSCKHGRFEQHINSCSECAEWVRIGETCRWHDAPTCPGGTPVKLGLEYSPGVPSAIEMVEQLRVALRWAGVADPRSPKAVWGEALTEVTLLMAHREDAYNDGYADGHQAGLQDGLETSK